MHNNTLYLFRRDLRIAHNKGFYECITNTKQKAFPLFIFTKEQVTDTNKYRSHHAIQFMIESLDDLTTSLKTKSGVTLPLLYSDNIINTLSKVIEANNIDALYITEDYTPYAQKLQHKMEKMCTKKNIDFVMIEDYNLVSPRAIKQYLKFTPYYNVHLEHSIENIPTARSYKNIFRIKNTAENVGLSTMRTKYVGIHDNPSIHVNGGRKEGLIVLKKALTLSKYHDTRDTMSKPTTNLSAYIKFGCLGMKEVYHALVKKFGKKNAIVRQLIWRDFYSQLLYHNPHLITHSVSLKEKYDKIKWNNNTKLFNAWKQGKTGYPIVDAGMRQLNSTGYMHNRARLLTSSFLIKNLQIDWRKGEKYFAQQLVDYDPASNNGNWQWVSGSGADSAPYFRIFSPFTQQEKHDPDCVYIKKWIPELQNVPNKDIHGWLEKHDEYNIYHKPIVDYSESRKKALDMYASALQD